jgi:hypothetical protein
MPEAARRAIARLREALLHAFRNVAVIDRHHAELLCDALAHDLYKRGAIVAGMPVSGDAWESMRARVAEGCWTTEQQERILKLLLEYGCELRARGILEAG